MGKQIEEDYKEQMNIVALSGTYYIYLIRMKEWLIHESLVKIFSMASYA